MVGYAPPVWEALPLGCTWMKHKICCAETDYDSMIQAGILLADSGQKWVQHDWFTSTAWWQYSSTVVNPQHLVVRELQLLNMDTAISVLWLVAFNWPFLCILVLSVKAIMSCENEFHRLIIYCTKESFPLFVTRLLQVGLWTFLILRLLFLIYPFAPIMPFWNLYLACACSLSLLLFCLSEAALLVPLNSLLAVEKEPFPGCLFKCYFFWWDGKPELHLILN